MSGTIKKRTNYGFHLYMTHEIIFELISHFGSTFIKNEDGSAIFDVNHFF